MRSLSTCLMACSTLPLCSLLALCCCPKAIGTAVRTRAAITSVRLMDSSPEIICSERPSNYNSHPVLSITRSRVPRVSSAPNARHHPPPHEIADDDKRRVGGRVHAFVGRRRRKRSLPVVHVELIPLCIYVPISCS